MENLKVKEVHIKLLNKNTLVLKLYEDRSTTISKLNHFIYENRSSIKRLLFDSKCFNYFINSRIILELQMQEKTIQFTLLNNNGGINSYNDTVEIILNNDEKIGIADFLLLMNMSCEFNVDQYQKKYYLLENFNIQYTYAGVTLSFLQ